ncbi:MAG: DUF1499 domain-containing protein [Oligoflexales bacterium]
MLKKIAYVGTTVIFLGIAFLSYRFYSLGIKSQKAENPAPGLKDGKLAACGEKPNCVSSMATEEQFTIRALELPKGSQTVFFDLVESLSVEEGVSVIQKTEVYAHLTYQSKIFGFTDDLELHLHPDTGRVDVRSSSRVGYSDMEANRKRVENIRKKFFGEESE